MTRTPRGLIRREKIHRGRLALHGRVRGITTPARCRQGERAIGGRSAARVPIRHRRNQAVQHVIKAAVFARALERRNVARGPHNAQDALVRARRSRRPGSVRRCEIAADFARLTVLLASMSASAKAFARSGGLVKNMNASRCALFVQCPEGLRNGRTAFQAAAHNTPY